MATLKKRGKKSGKSDPKKKVKKSLKIKKKKTSRKPLVKVVKKKKIVKKKVSARPIRVAKKKTFVKSKSLKKRVLKKPLKKKPHVSERERAPFLGKSIENPIIAPKGENGWEAWQTFNPGAILLKDKVHFLYRAIGQDGLSRLGYAMSEDGFKINERLPYPVFEHYVKQRTFNIHSYFSGGSWGGCEDPRIVRVNNEDVLYMTYTAVADGELRVALTSIKLKNFLKKIWKWKQPVLISAPGEVHKNWVIFPEKINGSYALLHSLNPKVQIAYLDNLNFENNGHIQSSYGGQVNEGCWDSLIKGAGPPPIKTEYGWLLFYHAIDKNDWSKYKAGAMILDFQDPTKILFRSKTPVLESCETYEVNGYKPGVIYISGAVVKGKDLLVYYGGADSFVCIAYANLKEFLESLIREVKPKLKQKVIKKK